MDGEEASVRRKYFGGVLNAIGGRLFFTLPPAEPPMLGDEFEIRSGQMFASIEKRRQRVLKHLNALPLDVLRTQFTEEGEPTTTEQRLWLDQERIELRDYVLRFNVWDSALFAQNGGLADFDHWAKSAYYTVDEAVLLSAGLEPAAHFIREIDGGAPGDRVDPPTRHLRAQRLLFRRALDPGMNGWKPTPEKILRWINMVDVKVHPGFRRMLEAATRTTEAKKQAAVAIEDTKVQTSARLDPRERTSMAKLLVLMAIDMYGYDPRAQRSPIPKEIEDIAHRNGIDLTAQTIRSYLRLGAAQLPKDWSKD